MERVLLVSVKLDSERDSWKLEDIALELEELTQACGVQIVDNVSCTCKITTANLLIGKGKCQEIALLCEEKAIDAVVFSHDLSGIQQRNLEEVISRKTIDRTQLILNIFARRAKSIEGKMQVELAQLKYLMPRLTGKGVVLSRLGGGIGTRGPGEQKLEVDRRSIRRRIDKLNEDLKQVRFHRQTLRKKRKSKSIPAIALVGYTHAGKSTLLNALTGADQATADSLFTTLDPLSRSLILGNGENIVISDTVGFLHQLPHHLIEAFKATLEEVTEADLLIHVLDISHPKVDDQYQAVREVLRELEADKKPIIVALNKIDLVDDPVWLHKLSEGFRDAVLISAKLKQGLGALLEKIQSKFENRMLCFEGVIEHGRMDLIDLFYREGKVEKIEYLQKGIKVRAHLPKAVYHKLFDNKELRDQET